MYTSGQPGCLCLRLGLTGCMPELSRQSDSLNHGQPASPDKHRIGLPPQKTPPKITSNAPKLKMPEQPVSQPRQTPQNEDPGTLSETELREDLVGSLI